MSKRKILLRFDDICPTMNWQQWENARGVMDKMGVKALLGVIPKCYDPDLQIDNPRPDFWDYIVMLQSLGYTIAMHGYHHVFDIKSAGIVTKKKHSEFAGHTYEEQYNRIRKGKEELLSHGIETDVFIAPAHSYDDNTLKALAANGFKYISDGYSQYPYKRHGIICIPCRNTRLPKRRGYFTIVFHAHEWTRPDKLYAWSDLCTLCTNSVKEIVPFVEYKKRKVANAFIQRINERLYYIWAVRIKPFLVKIRRWIK